jgi:hypothetical protein
VEPWSTKRQPLTEEPSRDRPRSNVTQLLLAFMIVVNMLGALILVPALSRFLLRA